MVAISKRLEGKVAIVTGGSSGIGRGIALRFASEGADVAICSLDPDAALASIRSDIEALGRRVIAERCDVSSRAEVAAFVAATVERLGAVNILVNNAAYMYRGITLEEYSEADWNKSIAVGLDAAFHFMQAVFPHMRDGGGKILNITSGAGIRGGRYAAGYAAAKGGMIALTRTAALDWAQHGIQVNCIAPLAMSEAVEGILKAHPEAKSPFEAMGSRPNALNRLGDPERDIAPPAAFLCSSEADFITGHVLPVDGGQLEID